MTPSSERITGMFHATGAYLLWGVLPIYLWFAQPTGTVELIAWRVILSLVFCAGVLTVLKTWPRFVALVRQPRVVLILALAGVLVLGNWLLYVWAVELGKPIEGALGYYLNPLVSMLFGMVFFGERMRPLQWVAIALAATALIVLIIGYGAPPWLSVSIAVTFALYGLVKKQLGARVDPVAGFTVETILVLPIALVMLLLVAANGNLTMGQVSIGHTLVLLCAGIITSLPLLLFASATLRLLLVEVGFFQFITPTMHFIVGLVLFGESMPLERWIGFAFVWAALVVFVVDMVRQGRHARGGIVPGPGA